MFYVFLIAFYISVIFGYLYETVDWLLNVCQTSGQCSICYCEQLSFYY